MPSSIDLSKKTPLEAGFRMPAEWEPHSRCWMAWPYRQELWAKSLSETQKGYAEVAKAIAEFEPVTMIAPPEASTGAAKLCGPGIEMFPLEIDDSWARDSGPLFLTREDGKQAATAWHFNAWGGKLDRYEWDARIASSVCERAGIPKYQSSLYLEGGAVHVDGEGTILTTESCVLNRNRNPDLTRKQAERELCRALGASKVIWLPGSLEEGDVTDGHIDGLACFVQPGVILLETALDPEDPRYKILQENRRALDGVTDAKGRPVEIVTIEEAYEAEAGSATFCRSYINFYVANGGVVMPGYGVAGDARARAVVEKLYSDRKVVQVDIDRIAIGGGGIHCITQQQPA